MSVISSVPHPHTEESCEICFLVENVIRPIIERQVRDQIADEIESDMEAMLPPVDNEEFAAYRAAEHCANIARGNR